MLAMTALIRLMSALANTVAWDYVFAVASITSSSFERHVNVFVVFFYAARCSLVDRLIGMLQNLP